MAKQMSVGFQINAPMPIDARMQVDTFNSLDLIPVKYDRMTSYVLDEDIEYRYFASVPEWLPLSAIAPATVWGDIVGVLTDQLDLVAKFSNYSLTTHTHPQLPPLAHTHLSEDITDLEDFVSLKSPYSTGLIKFGSLSINVDTTLFDIAAGIGTLNEWSPTEPFAPPVLFLVEFGPFTDIAPAFIATHPVSYIGISYNSTTLDASIVQSSTPFSPSERRDIIVLGFIQHINNVIIDDISNIAPQPIAGTSQLHDLFVSVGALNTSGNNFSPNGSGMTIDKDAGTIFKLGINSAINYKDPHNREVPLATQQVFQYRLQDGVEYIPTANINPNMWDDGGALIAVTAEKFTTQRVYILSDTTTRIQYGQAEYDSLTDAIADLESPTFITEPSLKNEAILRCYIIVKQGMGDFSVDGESKFFHLGKFSHIEGALFPVTYQAVVDALGFVPEDVANKVTDFTAPDDTTYPTTLAVSTLVEANKDQNVVFIQGSSATVWNIPHAMGKRPATRVYDGAGNRLFGDEVDIDDNNLRITYINAIQGVVILN
jgi:hypothetical protein